jgi:hypothetical protein
MNYLEVSDQVRFIGIDVHRDFCEIATHQAGITQSIGQVQSNREHLQALADSLGVDDWVSLETTGNARRIAEILAVNAGGVMVADARDLWVITHAKLKNDRVAARRLAELLAAGMLPGVWRCDEATRVALAQDRTALAAGPRSDRAASQIHAALIRELEGRAPTWAVLGPPSLTINRRIAFSVVSTRSISGRPPAGDSVAATIESLCTSSATNVRTSAGCSEITSGMLVLRRSCAALALAALDTAIFRTRERCDA